jgi:hypothetical protein
MTYQEAINVLKIHQEWRLGAEISMLEPKVITEAINVVLKDKNIEPLFATEDDAIKWVAYNIALAIKTKNKDKTMFVYPFTSVHAHIQVFEHLGKELFKYQHELFKTKQL